MNLLVLVGVGFVLLVVGTLLGRYYVPDRRPLQRAADEGRAYVRGLVELLAGDPTSAVSEIQQALQRNSKNVDAYFALGTLFRQRGEYERAVRVHQTLLVRRDVDKRTKLRVHQQLALDFEAAGFVRRATKALEYVIAHDKKNVAALRELGRLYQSSAEWERAAAVYKRIARVASEDQHEVIAHLLTMSAQQAMDQGSFASARKLLRKALSLDTTSVHTLHALASYHLREGDKRAAVKALRRALEIQPELVAAFLPPLDKALRDLKRPDELRTMLARLIEQHPENVHLQLASARVEARIDPERGLSALERLLQAHPTLLPARREAGKLLLERGDSEQIREAYQQLLQMLALVEQGFRCGACQHTVGDLFWRCKSCGSWGTVRVAWGRRLTERPEP
ncbi:MAG: tetratricopeptide repeat protein [Deltaproteobacteria bacterium]|nr:tetratricopeptide repeat protein [Myxococcales bacterium]MCB9556085.1 tetratricopeptide repeat protein [Deltaproteobacteria bacterium]